MLDFMVGLYKFAGFCQCKQSSVIGLQKKWFLIYCRSCEAGQWYLPWFVLDVALYFVIA